MLDARTFQLAFSTMLAGGPVPANAALRRAISIHRNTSRKAAHDALSANFPVVTEMVGVDAFAACASNFIDRYPPVDPRSCIYGGEFPAHVAGWHSFASYPYLGSVAALERLVIEAMFAPDVEPLDAATFTHSPNAQLRLSLHPATRIASFDCPAVSLWQAHKAHNNVDLTNIDWRPETALVTRPTFAVGISVIDKPTRSFLLAPTLGEAALASHDQGGDVAEIFSTLLMSGAFRMNRITEFNA
jgi:hypothetical protein